MTYRLLKMWPKRFVLAVSSTLIFLGCAPEHTTFDGQANSDKALKAVASNFKSINEVIFQPLCVRCHSGPKAPHKIDLSSYDSIMNNNLFPPLIVKGKPDSSSIYESIKSGKMPKKGRPLPPEAIQAVREWIETGALKDENSDGGGDDGGGEPPDDSPQEPPDQPLEPPD